MELSSIARPSSFKKGYWAYRLSTVMFLCDFHLVYAITSLRGVRVGHYEIKFLIYKRFVEKTNV